MSQAPTDAGLAPAPASPPAAGRPIPAEVSVRLVAILHPEAAGGFSVEVPALPGCWTQGETVEEALDNAVDAAEGWLLARHDINTGAVKLGEAGLTDDDL